MNASDERSGARIALAILTATYVVNFLDRQVLSILLVPIQRELGASDSAMGFLTGPAFAIFYTFAGLPIGRALDRGSRKWILAGGLALWSAMTAACGLASSFTALAFARIGVGVGEATCSPASHSLLADFFAPRRRATAISIYTSGIYAGMLLAFVFGGELESRFGWRTAFVVVGAPGLALALVVLAFVREPQREVEAVQRASTRETLRAILALRSFRHMALGAAAMSIAGYGLTVWSATFLQRVHGLSTAEAGQRLGPILGLSGACGALLGGWLADRLAARDVRWRLATGALASLAGLPFLGVWLFAPSTTLALTAFVPATMLGAMYLGPTFAVAQSLVPPHMRATAAALLLFVINLIGFGLGPQLVGWLSDALEPSRGPTSIRFALAIVSATYAWGALHMLLASRASSAELRGAHLLETSDAKH
jgi:predicted MFS family arabinose efflux permease